MEKITSLNLSLDKAVIQILIPGMLAVTPFLFLLLDTLPPLKLYLINNQTVLITTFTLLGVAAGMIVDNIGGRFEVHVIDKSLKDKFPFFESDWAKFLCITYEHEPVGHRYLRNMLFRMKFELSTGIALILMAIGSAIIACRFGLFANSFWSTIFCLIMQLLISSYLLFIEAKSSAKILAKTRMMLVDEFYQTRL